MAKPSINTSSPFVIRRFSLYRWMLRTPSSRKRGVLSVRPSRFLICAASVLLLATFDGTRVAAQTDSCNIVWDRIQQMTNNATNSFVPKLATVADTVHLEWTGDYRVGGYFYVASTNAGATWTEPFLIVDGREQPAPGYERLAASHGATYLVWSSCDSCGVIFQARIYMRRKLSAASSWGPRQTLPLSGSGYQVPGNRGFDALDSSVYVGYFNAGPGSVLISHNMGTGWERGASDLTFIDQRELVVTHRAIHIVQEIPGPRGQGEISYLRSTDDGASWSAEQVLSTNEGIQSVIPVIAADNDGNIYVAWNDGKYGGGFSGTILLRHSTDEGITWQSEQIVSQLATAVFCDVAVEGNLVAVAWDTGFSDTTGKVSVRLSQDRTATWCPAVDIALLDKRTGDPTIAIANRRIHFAWINDKPRFAAQVFYARSTPLPTSVGERGILPGDFSLLQNYPNPLNGETTISYLLPTASRVRLSVYNVLGQEVAVVVNALMPAGRHLARVNANNFSSGVYIYRLQTEVITLQRKMVVNK